MFAGRIYQLPPPRLCPDCRCQRRLSYRNERSLYYRRCDLTGRTILSMYPPEAPFPVYGIKDWLSDAWEPRSYGRDFDFRKGFFEQYLSLRLAVPHFNLFINPDFDENCEYTNCSSYSKNCYMTTQSAGNESCYYSRGITDSRDCADCLRVDHGELCYEGVNLLHCYQCLYCQDCAHCSDCHFSSELRSCSCCFGCHGLVQRRCCIYNEQVSQEQWRSFMRSLVLTQQLAAQIMAKSAALRLRTPRPALHQTNCENVRGEHVSNCRNCRHVFDSLDLEDCAYCLEVNMSAKDCLDLTMPGDKAELLYECMVCGTNAYRCLFSRHCWPGPVELTYCDSSTPGVKSCFGCCGLRRAEYCVLNKQYSKDEFERLVPQIIEHMQRTGEWGEFFPAGHSPFGYNETVALEYYPLSKEQVIARGWHWRDEPAPPAVTANRSVPSNIPIADVEENICSCVFACAETGRPFKIIKPELALYRKLGVPLPMYGPNARHLRRSRLRAPRRLIAQRCAGCDAAVESTNDPAGGAAVLCEKCFLTQRYASHLPPSP